MRRSLPKLIQHLAPDPRRQGWRGLPMWIVADVAALNVLGLAMVLSASSVPYVGLKLKQALDYSQWSIFEHQLLWLCIGSVLMWFAAIVDYRAAVYRLRRVFPLATFAFLLLVLVIGSSTGASRRWIVVPILGLILQPSELMKLAAVICGASMLSRDGHGLAERRRVSRASLATGTMGRLRDRPAQLGQGGLGAATELDVTSALRWVVTAVRCSSKYARYLVVMLLAALLVLAEPDLGTSALLLAIAAGMLFLSGARLRWLLGAGSLIATVLIASALIVPYERHRLLTSGLFSAHSRSLVQLASALHPSQLGTSIGALASGGVWGMGLGAGSGKWAIPNAHTDFIFAILGQQLGIVGCILVLLAFGALAWFGMRAAQRAPDRFGSLLAGGITWWIIVQAAVNIGAACGLLPITGVPLPFLSYGGTSLVVIMVAVGILVNVASHGSDKSVNTWPRGSGHVARGSAPRMAGSVPARRP